jgi:hypothetical protein
MNWANFNRQIAASRVSAKAGAAGRIAVVLDGLAEVTDVPLAAHAWYPQGVANGAVLNNYRYVDQDGSYCGTADAFCAEASSCVILILVDPQSRSHFLAHIAADTGDTGRLAAMGPDLHAFMVSVGNDLGRPNVFLFSQTIPRGSSTDELDNVMTLLSAEIRDAGLGWLAQSTYLIEGEGGIG